MQITVVLFFRLKNVIAIFSHFFQKRTKHDRHSFRCYVVTIKTGIHVRCAKHH